MSMLHHGTCHPVLSRGPARPLCQGAGTRRRGDHGPRGRGGRGEPCGGASACSSKIPWIRSAPSCGSTRPAPRTSLRTWQPSADRVPHRHARQDRSPDDLAAARRFHGRGPVRDRAGGAQRPADRRRRQRRGPDVGRRGPDRLAGRILLPQGVGHLPGCGTACPFPGAAGGRCPRQGRHRLGLHRHRRPRGAAGRVHRRRRPRASGPRPRSTPGRCRSSARRSRRRPSRSSGPRASLPRRRSAGVFTFEGQMVDEPLLRHARATLSRHEAARKSTS